jgi:hypothetical protein
VNFFGRPYGNWAHEALLEEYAQMAVTDHVERMDGKHIAFSGLAAIKKEILGRMKKELDKE